MTQTQKLEKKLNKLSNEINAHKLNMEQENRLTLNKFFYNCGRFNVIQATIALTTTLIELGYTCKEIIELAKDE